MNRTATCLAIAAMALGSVPPALANDFVRPGTCELILASRYTLSQAQDYARNIPDNRSVKIFEASNGWYAISIGALETDDKGAIIQFLKSSNQIPQDSYCSTGRKFVALYDWQTGTLVARTPDQPGQPVTVLQVYSPSDGYLNLRRGPSTGAPIVLAMYNGQRVTVLDRSGNWLKVRHGTGAVGWAYSEYLVSASSSAQARH